MGLPPDPRSEAGRHLIRGHHAPLSYHRALLDDPARLDAWDRAIRALVRPGMVVLDAGAGTGVLGMLAARAGARVHAVESTPIAALARELIARNGLADRITLHEADLVEMEPIEPVDVVLCDFIGRFVPDGTMHEAVRAAARWSKPDGRMIPSEVHLRVAPVGDIAMPELDAFRSPLRGLDLSPALPVAESAAYQTWLAPAALLGSDVPFATLTPPDVPASVEADLVLTAARDGLLRGFAGWFEAVMAPGITLDTRPGRPTFWGQVLWPVRARQVVAGEALPFALRAASVADGVAFAWRFGGAAYDSSGAAVGAGIPDPIDSADGIALYERGAYQPALHALLRDDDGGEPILRYLVAAHAVLGREIEAGAALDRYEAAYGRHPFVSRGG